MEIKLTADWILSLSDEIFFRDGKGCLVIYDFGFQLHIIEYTLKTLAVKYECEDVYNESDVELKDPSWFITLENIDDIKESCPELYNKFQKSIQDEIKSNEVYIIKRDIVIEFLDTPKTQSQIHKHLKTEFYKKQDDYVSMKGWIKKHTEWFIDRLLKEDVIRKKSKKYVLINHMG